MDETGISTVPNRTPKVITPKGKKTVCKILSAERGQTVTAVCCMSTTEVFVPPAVILPRKRMNPLLYKDAPNGTLPLISDTALIAQNTRQYCCDIFTILYDIQNIEQHRRDTAQYLVLIGWLHEFPFVHRLAETFCQAC
ncbi:hypothetical protein AVEN_214844-1 [Araneus ventricosus]|uniref:DDE-1 domain-containing protein n=1 Tax=Araneus ventricosus TaxID=182803 RepID=A0A4Y2E1C3_ARAVE|nr:hypothetical protein AVEN_234081-1 [Araneus ventricosus]GBM21820.1 hypothetical protein AVEN_91448-1 [Araneus ventricosus]GBM21828.1 hypothetical protein AVEN_121732-1 [Araneus ventricosus]GBM21848.1 hypothetical protein AVEN_214844-1 [Araneus ventricosus]